MPRHASTWTDSTALPSPFHVAANYMHSTTPPSNLATSEFKPTQIANRTVPLEITLAAK